MVHRLVVSYGQPTDPAQFDSYYEETHTPLALKFPGLQRISIGKPVSMDPSQPAPYLVAELDFESEDVMMAGLGSPEGKAAGKDMANFASGGATLVHYEVREVTPGSGA